MALISTINIIYVINVNVINYSQSFFLVYRISGMSHAKVFFPQDTACEIPKLIS
jgi:hypothetical protein